MQEHVTACDRTLGAFFAPAAVAGFHPLHALLHIDTRGRRELPH